MITQIAVCNLGPLVGGPDLEIVIMNKQMSELANWLIGSELFSVRACT